MDGIYSDGVKAKLKKQNERDEVFAKSKWEDAGVATWVTKGSMATGIKEAAGGVVDFVTQDPMNHVNNIKSGIQESADRLQAAARLRRCRFAGTQLERRDGDGHLGQGRRAVHGRLGQGRVPGLQPEGRQGIRLLHRVR